MKKIFLSLCAVYFVFCTSALAATSPVVQVVSYKEPLGLYFALQGWGSGSVIDSQGHIITNNHVVDDGLGGVSDDFAICMTDDPSLPPRCHYTASVIARDADADVAVLQLDGVDIFGNKVDFNTLSPLVVNTDYLPQSGDTVIARGYPWVGANTITETQGIISGTALHNGNTYIKTDTLIAGGNSGGPLIRDGRLIGVNTFLVGGGYDPSLGYSLLISEVKDFIQSALSRTQRIQSNNPVFPQFLQKIETFSSQNKISDPLISIVLPKKYTIVSYIPATSFSASLVDSDTTSVSALSFFHIRTPRIRDLKELQTYISQQLGAPTGVFQPVTIGGKTLYELSFDESTENSKTRNTYLYFMIVDETHLLFLYFETPVPTKNTLEKIQQSVKEFLGYVTFPSTFVFPKPRDIAIPNSGIGIKLQDNSSVSYDITEYSGFLADAIVDKQNFVMVGNFLGNFWSKAQLAVFKNSFETEDDSVDTWLTNITTGMYNKPSLKKKVTYKGHEGFLICLDDFLQDETGKNNDIVRCEGVFLIGDRHEFILSSQMILPRKQLAHIDTLMVQHLDNIVQIPNLGETVFAEKAGNRDLPYNDVGEQNTAFKDALKTLISYGILQSRPLFDGDAPLRWREYFSLYIWAVYHRRMTDIVDSKTGGMTFEKVLSVLPVQWDEYAEGDIWQIEKIDNLIRLLVAGGSLKKYDFDTVYDFSNSTYQEEGLYRDAWNQIFAFENTYFPERKPLDPAKYTTQKAVTYNPFTGLKIQSKDSAEGTIFFRNTLQQKTEAEKILRCDTNATLYFSVECRDLRKKSLLSVLSYPVLTKGKAIENILGHIDATLWTLATTK